MGICLDTEQNHGSQVFDERQVRDSAHEFRYTSTPPDGVFPMHNGGNVQFETPKVPVIFVLGGPGSGKVTHCDNLMQEKRGIAHINMTDLLQQYAIGNDGQEPTVITSANNKATEDMQDFGQLSSKTVTEVLMLEMKMSPNAKTYLISGYPRNMRDVVEYSEKIQVMNGVVLVSWRQKVLERQIDYGAKLGQVVLSLAKMELENFYKNVMPVADYFDQSGMLISVNGERHPGDVYKDFREAVMRILGMQNNPPELTTGRTAAITNGIEPVVNSTTDTSSRNITAPIATTVVPGILPSNQVHPEIGASNVGAGGGNTSSEVITVRALDTGAFNSPVKPGWPPVIWVIGGPGSNKEILCAKAVVQKPGWVHISVGRLLRAAAEPTDTRNMSDAQIIRQSISAGEVVPPNIVMQILEANMTQNMSAMGLLIDGYPRDIKQANEFEVKFKQKPTMVLLDCSKLQLGRGRLDDSVSAFRRRLEVFRELSLPMLKSLDNDGRLIIVDGDTDSPQVQEDFSNVIVQQMEELQLTFSNRPNNDPPPPIMGAMNNNPTMNHNHHPPLQHQRTMVEDLTSVTGLDTISHRVSENMRNGVANGVAISNGYVNNAISNVKNGIAHTTNGFIANGNAMATNAGAAMMSNGTQMANGLVNAFHRNGGIPGQTKIGNNDLYSNIAAAANKRRGEIQMYDMDNANHI